MADGKITIETSIDNAGALKDLNKLINQVNSSGKKAADTTSKSFSGIGKAASSGVKIAAGAIAAVGTALVTVGGFAIKTGIEFESAFAGVKKTVDAPKEQIDQLRQSLIEMSKVMPQSATELAGIAEAAGQLGIETSNIESFTKTMAQLGDATNLSATEAADSLARFANITGMSQGDFDKLGSTIVSLGNNMATTEQEIVAMGMRLAGAGHQVGMSEAQIMSFSAALSSVGIEAEAGGSAFSTVMSQMQLATEQGGQSLEDFASVAGMSADEFKTAFQQDASSAILAFVEGLSNCESQGKSAIGVLDGMGISEIRQRDALLRAAGASDVFAKALSLGSEAWEENTSLANEASQRYETLESKLAMMKNSASALGIQFKDSIDGQLRSAVQVGTDSINQLSDAFTNGGLDAAVTTAGDIIAGLTVKIANTAPDVVRSASTLLKSFVKGISDHKGEILNAGIGVAKALAEGIADLLPSSMSKPAKEAINVLAKSMKSGGLKEAAADVVNVFKNMANLAAKAIKPAAQVVDLLAKNFGKVAPAVAATYTAMKLYAIIQALANKEGKISATVTAASTAVTKVKSVVTAILAGQLTVAAAAQQAFNAAMAAFGGPIGLAITAIATLLAGIGVFALTSRDSTAAVQEESNALAENAQKIKEAQVARQESVDGLSQEYGHYQELWGELQKNVDANGQVKAGYEERASFIVSTLNSALGTEIQMNGNVIESYGELCGSIDQLIEKKRQEAMLEAYKSDYEEAVKRKAEANKELAKTYGNLQEAQKNARAAQDELTESGAKSGYRYDQLKGQVDMANGKLKEAKAVYGNAKIAADEYNNVIANYESASGAVISGSANASSAIALLTNNMATSSTATEAELAKQVETYRSGYENMKLAAAEGGSGVTQQMVTDAQLAYLAAAAQHMLGQGMTQAQVAAGMETLRSQIGMSGLPEAAATEAGETTTAMSSSLLAGAPAAQAGADAVTSSAKSGIENSGLAEVAGAEGAGVGNALGTNIASGSGAVSSGAAAVSNSAKTAVAGANIGSAFQAEGTKAGTQMSSALSSQTGAAAKAATALSQAAQKALASANLPNFALTLGKQFGESLARGIQSQSGLVGSASNILVSSAKMGANSLATAGNTIGRQFSAGLATGIREGVAGVAAAAASVAKQAAEAAKANLDINSPSKVTEKLGYWYDKGMELGIKRNADGIIQAVHGLTDKIVPDTGVFVRSTQAAFDSNINRIASRYANGANREVGSGMTEMDYERLGTVFARKLAEYLDGLGIQVNLRELARIVREVK